MQVKKNAKKFNSTLGKRFWTDSKRFPSQLEIATAKPICQDAFVCRFLPKQEIQFLEKERDIIKTIKLHKH